MNEIFSITSFHSQYGNAHTKPPELQLAESPGGDHQKAEMTKLKKLKGSKLSSYGCGLALKRRAADLSRQYSVARRKVLRLTRKIPAGTLFFRT